MATNAEPPDQSSEMNATVEDLLATYARDLRALYRQRQSLVTDATQAKEVGELRGREISALNTLTQRSLIYLSELEQDYESLLEELERLAQGTQPNQMGERIQAVVQQRKLRLQQAREGVQGDSPRSL